jgi:hypothetical protein
MCCLICPLYPKNGVRQFFKNKIEARGGEVVWWRSEANLPKIHGYSVEDWVNFEMTAMFGHVEGGVFKSLLYPLKTDIR